MVVAASAQPPAPLESLRKRLDDALLPDARTDVRVQLSAHLDLMLVEHGEKEDAEAVRKLQTQLERRQLALAPLGLVDVIWTFIRVAIFAITVLILAPIEILIAVPLRMLNPLWRKCGADGNTLPTELMQLLTFRWAIYCLRIQIVTNGGDKLPNEPMLFMYSHASNLDPLALGAVTPLPIRFIGKRVLFNIPIIGWLFLAYGHIPIDRGNREAAIESLKTAARGVRRSNASIAVSPEGTRSMSGCLQQFKKGPFHLALRAGIPIVPVIVTGAFDLWPPGALVPRPGSLALRFLDPIRTHIDRPDVDINELSRVVRRAMLQGQLLSAPSVDSGGCLYLFHETVLTIFPAAVIVLGVVVTKLFFS